MAFSLYSPKGEKENFNINTTPLNEKYQELNKLQKNDTIRGFDLSVVEYENKYKTKPFICKISEIFKKYKFENNLPSNFLKMVTGKEPTTIAEKDFNINLTKHKTEVLDLFAKMSQEKDYSFVIMNGLKKFNNRRFHVYVIENVDMEKLRKHVLSTMACHSSIRFHRSLTMEEMKQVIVDLQKCEQPYHCPHGRPTVITISDQELLKEFERG